METKKPSPWKWQEGDRKYAHAHAHDHAPGDPFVTVGAFLNEAEDMRNLALWLESAAEWIERQAKQETTG
jgi:hypothetical protein